MERLERDRRIEEARLAEEKMRAEREAKVLAYQAEVEAENKRRFEAAEYARIEAQQRMEQERLEI